MLISERHAFVVLYFHIFVNLFDLSARAGSANVIVNLFACFGYQIDVIVNVFALPASCYC